MYEPKQIPYLLDSSFREYVHYEEFKFLELDDFCMCIWQMKSKQILDKTIYNYILPDACIDIIINFVDKTIYFSGYSKETMPFVLNQCIDYMGVRLKPGAFYAIFKIEADRVMDHAIPLSKEEAIYDILDISDLQGRLTVFKNYLLSKIQHVPCTDFILIVEQLYQEPKDQSVQMIAQRFGYDPRHLYRLFKKHYGVSPKVLLNILRLHLSLSFMLDDHQHFSDFIWRCGFYDQAHFIKEVKRYTGFSPLQLLEND